MGVLPRMADLFRNRYGHRRGFARHGGPTTSPACSSSCYPCYLRNLSGGRTRLPKAEHGVKVHRDFGDFQVWLSVYAPQFFKLRPSLVMRPRGYELASALTSLKRATTPPAG